MGFKTFVALDPFYAADANDYLMKQVVIVCTAGTRPSSPVEGMTIYQTDDDKVYIYSGSAWIEFMDLGAWDTFVPTLTQSAGVATSSAIGRYRVRGKEVSLHVFLICNAAGSAGNAVIIGGIPAAIAPRVTGSVVTASNDLETTTGTIHDASAALYMCHAFPVTASTWHMVHSSVTAGGLVGATPSFALAATDSVRLSAHYEIA